MAFVDELKIYAKAGRGGDGVVRWLHEKGKEFGGPAGGDGGKGGDVYAECVRDIHILSKYRHQKEFRAEDGRPGEGASRRELPPSSRAAQAPAPWESDGD